MECRLMSHGRTGSDKPAAGKAARAPRFPTFTGRFFSEKSGRAAGQAHGGQFNRILLDSGLVYYTPTGAKYQ